MKVLNILASNRFSGAENVVCQIVDMFKGEIEMAYCSPDGDIRDSLKERNVNFLPVEKLTLGNIKKIVETYQPDIIHAHDLKAIAIVSLLGKKYRKVGHIHVNDKDNMGKFSLKSFALKLVANKFEHLFWVSKSCFEEYKYKNKLAEKSSILYNIINLYNLCNKALEDKHQYNYDIVYLGRLTYQKNCLRLLEIANVLKQKGQKFKFAIIGTGDKEQEMKEYISSNHLDDCVEMLGFLSNGYKILSQSKLMLMTSLFEGTPMCALEALGLGIPIVTTKTDGMIDLIKDGYNGYLYDTNEQAAEYINQILNDNQLQKHLSQNAKEFSQKYNDIQTYKNNLLKVYIKRK